MPDDLISYPPGATEPAAAAADFEESGALTREFLLRRGRCCQEGCRNCPYGFRSETITAADSGGKKC